MDSDFGIQEEIERNYRRLIERIILTAIRDLAWVKAGEKVRRIPPAVFVFGKGTLPYPRRHFYSVCGTSNPEEELKIFFESDYFEEWASLLESSLGFKIKGKSLLDADILPEFLGNLNE